MTHRLATILTTCLLICGCTPVQYNNQPTIKRITRLGNSLPLNGWCGALPKVQIAEFADNVNCVGLIDDRLIFPRSVVALGEAILVVDKGSDLQHRSNRLGRVYLYTKPAAKQIAKRVLLAGLDNPSGLSLGRGESDSGYAYVSTRSAVIRFDPRASNPAATAQVVISGLQNHGWHYLNAIYVTQTHLYLSVPSRTDHCELTANQGLVVEFPCLEVSTTTADEQQSALLRRYRIDPEGQVSVDFEIVARGLRNALAFAETPAKQDLLIADNGWDQIPLARSTAGQPDIPADEINLLHPGDHYGWPYCFANNQVTPTYRSSVHSCTDYRPPQLLLPVHSVPVAMIHTQGNLIVNLHGFATLGHRTVTFATDTLGLPIGEARTLVSWNYQHVPGFNLGRPFGITRLPDGSLIVSDDVNHALLRVAFKTPTTAIPVSAGQP